MELLALEITTEVGKQNKKSINLGVRTEILAAPEQLCGNLSVADSNAAFSGLVHAYLVEE